MEVVSWDKGRPGAETVHHFILYEYRRRWWREFKPKDVTEGCEFTLGSLSAGYLSC